MRIIVGVLLALMAALPAFANDEKRLTAGEMSGVWTGQWTSPKGFVYAATLDIQIRQDGFANGSLTWVLKQSPRAEDRARVGKTAIEYVSGRTNMTARTMTLAGTRKDDPENLIELDRYKMVISDDGRVMGGLSLNRGDWLGQIVLTR